MKNSFHFGSCSNCKEKSGHMNRYTGSGVTMQLCDRCMPGNRFYVERYRGFFGVFHRAWDIMKELTESLQRVINRQFTKEKTAVASQQSLQRVNQKAILSKARRIPINKAAINPQMH